MSETLEEKCARLERELAEARRKIPGNDEYFSAVEQEAIEAQKERDHLKQQLEDERKHVLSLIEERDKAWSERVASQLRDEEVRKALQDIADNEWSENPGCSTKSEQLAKRALQLLEGKTEQ